ncbi:hypothetical protein PAXRUDRAFT_771728 [Paxillus rubicundulus Ve08.2h10]|uniref:Uncharacterized protein n=1 Tax=Paxillus rubicundulus Ve08.2h10 TaxID=930991 RepID=A0A0D0CTR7_9AGAM|nr:hypothetical protein PAXRUDRAFT_771728 [Paxillus rubicundulus Ve08.2h10]
MVADEASNQDVDSDVGSIQRPVPKKQLSKQQRVDSSRPMPPSSPTNFLDNILGGMPDKEAEDDKQPTCQEDEEEYQRRGVNREDEQESYNVLEGNKEDEDKDEGDGEEVWGAATQIREIMYKARMAVPLAYGLPGQLKGEELGNVLKWLIEEGKILHPNINVKLIKAQWWGPKGGGKRLGNDSRTNPFLNAPSPMLALVVVAINQVGMLTGLATDFNDTNFQPRWEYYLNAMKVFETRSLTYLQRVRSEIQDATGGVLGGRQPLGECAYVPPINGIGTRYGSTARKPLRVILWKNI